MDLLGKLAGGDRRSIGRSNEVAADVLADPRLFPALCAGLDSADPLVRMRAADALEKVTARRPDTLQPGKAKLIRLLASSEQPEVRWHLAQMLPRLALEPAELAAVVPPLLAYLDDPSKTVQTSALQALADLAGRDEGLRAQVAPLLEERARTGSPAVRSRARRLLSRLSAP